MANRYAMMTGDGGDTRDWFRVNAPPTPSPNTGISGYGQGGGTVPLMQTQTAMPSGGPTFPNVFGNVSGALTGGGGPVGGNYQDWFMNLVGNRPWNQQSFNALVPTLRQYGFAITPPNAAGDQTKIQTPSGQWVRVGFGEGHPVWIPQDTGGSGALMATGQPAPAWAGLPPTFQAPTGLTEQNDPGYQARLTLGQQALERSAAARGSLLGGGFQQQLARYAQNYATNEYANVYNRALQNYQTNYQTQYYDPQQRALALSGQGLQGANILAGAGRVPLTG